MAMPADVDDGRGVGDMSNVRGVEVSAFPAPVEDEPVVSAAKEEGKDDEEEAPPPPQPLKEEGADSGSDLEVDKNPNDWKQARKIDWIIDTWGELIGANAEIVLSVSTNKTEKFT